jgi:alkylation response protein AidB-like acyl-CoA dehydrogenase
MDFGLSEEQRLLQDTIRRLLADVFPTTRAREASQREDGHDAKLWSALAEQGALGALIAERHGGSELSFLDAMLVAEEVGRAAGPGAYVASAVMAALALRETDESLAKQLLPEIAAGRTRVGVGLAEASGARDGAGLRTVRGKLEGTALFALDAIGAEHLLLFCEGGLVLLPARGNGVTVSGLQTVDLTRRVAEVKVASAEPLVRSGGLARVLAAGRIALAFDSLGCSERALELALGYARERQQFGRVIGSFQAVKHMLAEIAAVLEPARSLCWYTAFAFEHEPAEAERLAALCKAHVSEVATEVLRKATEVHGGIGFTEQYDLHLWFRRVAQNRPLLGGPELLRESASRLRAESSRV